MLFLIAAKATHDGMRLIQAVCATVSAAYASEEGSLNRRLHSAEVKKCVLNFFRPFAAGCYFTVVELPRRPPARLRRLALRNSRNHSPGGNLQHFTYTNNGVGHDAEFTTTTSVPVDFTYLSVNGVLPADLQGVQNATLTLTSSTIEPVQTFGSILAMQEVNGTGATVDLITITRDTPAAEGSGSRENLLTVSFTDELLGQIGGETPQLSADSSLGDLVNYTSDFVNIANATQRDFSLTFSSWTTDSSNLGLEVDPSDNFFQSAAAAGAGTFDAAAAIPEPSSLVIAAAALLGVLPLLRKRRITA